MPESALAGSQRRNVALLALTQALFMSVQGMGAATTPLAGYTLLGADEKWLATVPVFLMHVGIMATTIPASLIMGLLGRRAGFAAGSLLGVLGGTAGCLAVYRQSFLLLCLAAFCQGMQAAFFWYFRLAAADAAPPAFRAKAISLVMAGGVLAGFIGPQAAKWSVDWLPVTFAGVYVAMAGFSVVVLLLVQLLQIPGLTSAERAESGRPMAAIARQPAYRVALASSVFGYAVMTLTMSATPLAMLACGFSLNLLTILAIVLSVGLVVDDAIVVVENVERHVREGKSRIQAALIGARELKGPVIAMTITLAAVYAPIGALFGEWVGAGVVREPLWDPTGERIRA